MVSVKLFWLYNLILENILVVKRLSDSIGENKVNILTMNWLVQFMSLLSNCEILIIVFLPRFSPRNSKTVLCTLKVGPTVAQLVFFVGSDYLEVVSPFLCFIIVC